MASPTENTTKPPSKKKTIAANIRETLESIVIAFVLAFVFRAFIVEAFVIPTGSMAATLYGDHATNTCSTCGYEYAHGLTETDRNLRTEIQLRCPNCFALTDTLKPQQYHRPESGDRILVYKYPFELGGLGGPKRWEVTVFKDPKDGQTNFIKRLVGLPGEVLVIIDGDIYTASVEDIEKTQPELLTQLETLRQEVYQFRFNSYDHARQAIITKYQAINEQLLPLLKIQRKWPDAQGAQQSLWSIVYDHDFLPNPDKSRVCWKPREETAAVQAWDTSRREITFNSDCDDYLSIDFWGKPIIDFYAYNRDDQLSNEQLGYRHGRNSGQHSPNQPVGDLRCRFTWFPEAGTGGIQLTMNRDRDRFVAEIGVDGSVQVTGYQPDAGLAGGKQLIGPEGKVVKLDPFTANQPVKIEFLNIDYRVSLLIDGKPVITSTDEQYAPSPAKLLRFLKQPPESRNGDGLVEPSRVTIAARKLKCRIRHLVLERDIYYLSNLQSDMVITDKNGTMIHNPYRGWPCWGTAGHPILLRKERTNGKQTLPAEYFMLGDNSPGSLDSRLWWVIGPHLKYLGGEYQVGTVPEDQLIGRAFFVYWPAGYRSPLTGGVGLVPNVGQMRWIR